MRPRSRFHRWYAMVVVLAFGVVTRGGDDPPALRGQRVKALQQPPRLGLAPEQAEVVHEHDHGVEAAEPVVHVLEREHLDVPDTAAAGHATNERRDVDSDDRVAAALKLERDPARADSGVENAPADVSERLSL